jgi:hypothetical protein
MVCLKVFPHKCSFLTVPIKTELVCNIPQWTHSNTVFPFFFPIQTAIEYPGSPCIWIHVQLVAVIFGAFQRRSL